MTSAPPGTNPQDGNADLPPDMSDADRELMEHVETAHRQPRGPLDHHD